MTDDNDSTGMRHLLAGLKESGPMPADLNERIRASLADEQTARAGESAGDASDESSTFWRTMDDEGGRPRRRRRSGAPWILGAAAATVVALGVGGLMLRGSGSDDASSSAPQQSAAAPDEAGGSGERSDSSATASADDEVPAFVVTASGTDYTRDGLADRAAKILENPTEFPDNTNDKALGTLTTAAGATDCLGRLGQPQMQAVVIDVARFDGRDGLLLIGDSPPDGPARAWAVTSGCEPIWPGSVEVPRR